MREISSPLDGFASPFGPQRGFNPLRIFANDEPGVWFEANDATTLFTDVAGTTPVTTPGDAVALQLDKSQGLTLGPELVTNGGFDTDTDWAKSGHWVISGGAATMPLTSGYLPLYQVMAFTSAKTYLVEFDVTAITGTLQVLLNDDPITLNKSNILTVSATGRFSGLLTAQAGAEVLAISRTGGASSCTIDNISVRELPGNHRTQATTAARPLYALHPVGGVRNELVSTNTLATQNVAVTAAERTLSFKGTGTVTLSGASTAGPLVGTGAEEIVSLTFTPTAGTLTLTVSGTVEEAQLELGAARTNYQTVGSTFLDVSEEGKARRGRIWYNGTSHFMQTPTITPGTDKVQVFAGVRKLSDAARILIESSTDINSNAGSFYLVSGEDKSARYSSLGRGSASAAGVGTANWVDGGLAPDSAVLTATHDIAGDLSRIRRNGVFGVDATGDKGTGNFLAYPLYFGARAGTSLFYNGYEDTSIIRFGPNLDDTTISKVESYVASKTPEGTI